MRAESVRESSMNPQNICLQDTCLRNAILVFSALIVVVNLFVFEQMFGGGLPGTMAVPGGLVGACAVLVGFFGAIAVIRKSASRVLYYCYATVAFGCWEIIRGIVDLSTAAPWCRSHCQAGSDRCPDGVKFCTQQIEFASGMVSLILAAVFAAAAYMLWKHHMTLSSEGDAAFSPTSDSEKPPTEAEATRLWPVPLHLASQPLMP